MVLRIALGVLLGAFMLGIVGCASGEAPVEGDAEVTKNVDTSGDQQTKDNRGRAMEGGSNQPAVLEPPPPDGN